MSCSLTAFAAIIEKQLVVRSRHHVSMELPPWYARFEGAEVMQNGGLLGTSGDGDTPEAALTDYAKNISGKRLAFGAYTDKRQEFNVPQLSGV